MLTMETFTYLLRILLEHELELCSIILWMNCVYNQFIVLNIGLFFFTTVCFISLSLSGLLFCLCVLFLLFFFLQIKRCCLYVWPTSLSCNCLLLNHVHVPLWDISLTADVVCCVFSTEVVETDTSGASVTDDEGKYHLLTLDLSQKTCIINPLYQFFKEYLIHFKYLSEILFLLSFKVNKFKYLLFVINFISFFVITFPWAYIQCP